MAKQQTPGSSAACVGEELAAPEQFRPASLSALVEWLFGSRKPAASEAEPFDEHINGLA